MTKGNVSAPAANSASGADSLDGSQPIFWLAVVGSGLLVGALSVAFHVGLNLALALRERFTAWARPMDLPGLLLLIAVCAAAVGLAVWLTARFAPMAAGSGIQHVEGVERGQVELWPFSVVWVKFVGGIVGIGGGLVLGREGPTVQMGASIAERLGMRLGLPAAARRALLVVGAGAGLSGAFNAPLAGTLLVMEELKCPMRPAFYLATLLASLITDLVCRVCLGQAAELALPPELPPPWLTVLPVLLVGLACGLVGAVFNAAVLRSLVAMDACKRHLPGWLLGAALGAVLGAVAWQLPALPGGGVNYAVRVLSGGVTLNQASVLLPLSFVLTTASYAAGAPGGIFAPLLVLGALLGPLFHGLWAALIPTAADATPVLAVAGMVALFAAIVRAPLTGTVLLIEMTGAYSVVLPLIIASLVAYWVAEALGSKPIYESLLEREIEKRHPAI